MKNKFYFATALLLCAWFSNGLAQAQLKKWYLSPLEIDVSLTVPVVSSLGVASGVPVGTDQYHNGIYDNNGTLMFYVTDDNYVSNAGAPGIYNRNNQMIMNYSFPLDYAGCEVAVVPVPGNSACGQSKYYVFRMQAVPAFTPGVNLDYILIDMNLNNGLGGAVGIETIADFIPGTVFAGEIGGLAVGKEINGQRFIYYCGGSPGEVRRITLSSAGLSAPILIYSNPAWEFAAQELDLSPDGRHLAWADWGVLANPNRYHKIDLNAAGTFVAGSAVAFNVGSNVNNLSIMGGRGVEFDATSSFLYLGAGGDGIFVTPVASISPQVIPNTGAYGFSQIELAQNGFIYAANAIDMLAIDPSNNTIAPGSNISTTARKVNYIADFYLLPDQIDGEDYSSFLPGSSVVYTATNYNSGAVTQLWQTGAANNPFGVVGDFTAPVFIKDELRIPSGADIIIDNNMEFRFGPEGKIIVERGAKLTIRKVTLAPATNCPWTGIELWGNRALSQFNTTSIGQGVLKVEGSHFIGARDAITTIRNTPAGFDWNYTGGIVKVSLNAVFEDCWRGIQLLSYRNFLPNNPSFTINNFSRIEESFFYTTPQYNYSGLGNPYAFITMFDVQGIKILGNTFDNFSGQVTPAFRGNGIISVDSRFVVDDGLFTSSFSNLHYAIDASSYNPINSVSVINTDFINNSYGVLLTGMNYPVVIKNTFNVPAPSSYISYGLYLNFCSYYQIEGNQFIGFSATNNVGSITTSSGKANNIIYNNQFSNFFVAALAINNNDGPTIADGLRYNCNEFLSASNVYDIAVTGNQPAGIGNVQGICSSNPNKNVRNTYSAPCIGNENQFNVDQTWAPNTIYHASFLPGPDITNPVCKDNLVFNFQCTQTFDRVAMCPYTWNCNPPCQLVQITSLETENQALRNQIDGGNTSALLGSINSNMSNGELKNLLLSKSPYLSDEVLIAAINRTNSMPPGQLKEILIANSPLTPAVIAALDARQPQLPPGIRNQINDAQTGVSARAELEMNIGLNESNINLSYDNLIRFYLHDTSENGGLDSVIAILDRLQRDDAKCQKGMAQIAYGDLVGAQITIDEMLLDPTQAEFCRYLQILALLRAEIDACVVVEHDPDKEQEVRDIAGDYDDHHCINAQVILKYVFNDPIQELIILPTQSANRLQDASQLSSTEEIHVYPNPTSDVVNVEIESILEDFAYFMLYDVNGKQVYQSPMQVGINAISLEGLEPGIYMYSILGVAEEVQNGKLVITGQ